MYFTKRILILLLSVCLAWRNDCVGQFVQHRLLPFSFPAKKKRPTAEEALELFRSLPENSNNSDDEFESTDDEIWDVPQDEISGNESDLKQAHAGCSSSQKKRRHPPYAGKIEKKEKHCFDT